MKTSYFTQRFYLAICIIAFLAYVNVGLFTLPHLASVLTGDVVRRFHLLHLPPVDREVRFEVIYVLIAFSGIWLFSKLRGNVRLNITSLQFSKFLSETIVGFLLLLVSWLFVVVILAYFEGKPVVANHNFPLIELLVLYLLAAIAEETVFRGYVFQMTEKYWGTGIALCVSSILFGLDHLMGARMSFYNILCIVVFGGVTYSAAFAYSRRLWLPIGLHWGYDFGMSLFNSDYFYVKLYQTDVSFEAGNTVTCLELLLGIILVFAAIRNQEWHSFRNTQTTLYWANRNATSSAE